MAAKNISDLLNRLFPWRRARLNRKFKDHLFRFLFQEKNELLSLYNAVNGTNYSDPAALTAMTLEDVIYLGMKNDVSFLIDGRLNLYEHQSSICPNCLKKERGMKPPWQSTTVSNMTYSQTYCAKTARR